MDPSPRETPGINLPAPVAEQAPDVSGNTAASAPEQGPTAPQAAPGTSTAPPAAALPTTQLPTTSPFAPVSAKSDDTSTTPPASADVIDDKDRVEKQWVDRVKRVIAKTKHDPYRQSEELTAVKADYMKQHYNKIIKVER